MSEALLLSDDKYAEFYDIQFEEEVNEIQHIQQSIIEIAEEQAKDNFGAKWSGWLGQGRVPEKTETRGKLKEVLLTRFMFDLNIFKMKDRDFPQES